MPEHIIAPTNRKKRGKQIKNHHGSYAEWIEELQSHKHLNAIKLIQRLEKGTRRISKFKNLSQREILRRQSLFLNKQAGYLTDAVIERLITFKEFQKLSPKQRGKLYAEIFTKTIDRIILPKIKDPMLRNTLIKFDLYFSLPENIHQRRTDPKRWEQLKKIRNEVINSGKDPKENLIEAITKTMNKRKQGETYSTKAMDVCETASVYADILKKQGNTLWTSSYREAMEIIYPQISKDEKLLDAVINLSKTNPRKDRGTPLANKYGV